MESAWYLLRRRRSEPHRSRTGGNRRKGACLSM